MCRKVALINKDSLEDHLNEKVTELTEKEGEAKYKAKYKAINCHKKGYLNDDP
ncbi:MAG: hypothetical protein ACLFPF_10510 [Halanaerobiales bacterium]